MKYISYQQIQKVLRLALSITDITIKAAAEQAQISNNTLYRWTSKDGAQLSQENTDKLYEYFADVWPQQLAAAEQMLETMEEPR